jgi:hypothetical protein
VLDPFLFRETTIRLLVLGQEVVLRPRTLGEVERAAHQGRTLDPGWVIVEGSLPSFPDTAEGAEQRKAWWAALEEAAEGLDEMLNPRVQPATVAEWAELLAAMMPGKGVKS